MSGKVLRIDAVTAENRHDMTERARQAIASCGGSILDFRQFSNASVCITFEIAAARLAGLRAALSRAGLRLSAGSLDSIAEACEAAGRRGESGGAGELDCTLAVFFVHDEPDLRIEVPAVPG